MKTTQQEVLYGIEERGCLELFDKYEDAKEIYDDGVFPRGRKIQLVKVTQTTEYLEEKTA